DKSTALYAVIGILGALVQRSINGRGQQIEVPMFESMVHFLSVEHLDGLSFDPPLGDSGYARVTSPLRRPYRTRDGYLAAMPYTGAQWAAIFAWCGDEHFFSDPRFADEQSRARHIGLLHARLSELMPMHPSQAWVDFMEKADIPFSRVNSLDTLIDDPHLHDVGLWQLMSHPALGMLRAASLPIRYGGPSHGLPVVSRAPLLGEHTHEVLSALGLSAADIRALASSGVVKLAPGNGIDA
ncbi:MAG: CoA transferase, partial [Rhizobacter sp.]|nr:CoA transferase [Rhizobacter sp.]